MVKKLILLSQILLLLQIGGCQKNKLSSGQESCCPDAFRVEKIVLNSSFTQLRKSKDDLAQPDTMDVFVELRDQFDDPIKATGKFRFEIYLYQKKASNDHRGKRFPTQGLQWVDLTEPQLNQDHWDKITRCYQFTLQLGEHSENLDQLVLQVTYLNNSNYRLEDMLTLKYTTPTQSDSPIARNP